MRIFSKTPFTCTICGENGCIVLPKQPPVDSAKQTTKYFQVNLDIELTLSKLSATLILPWNLKTDQIMKEPPLTAVLKMLQVTSEYIVPSKTGTQSYPNNFLSSNNITLSYFYFQDM